MATSLEYVKFVCDQIHGLGDIRYRKMFGEYMIYLNDKPILLICDDTVFVKKLECIVDKMLYADTGIPYEGAKEHYILDIESSEFSREIIVILEKNTNIPKSRKSKK